MLPGNIYCSYLEPSVLHGPSGTENSHFSFSKFYPVKLILWKEIPVLDTTILMANIILEVTISISQLPRLEGVRSHMFISWTEVEKMEYINMSTDEDYFVHRTSLISDVTLSILISHCYFFKHLSNFIPLYPDTLCTNISSFYPFINLFMPGLHSKSMNMHISIVLNAQNYFLFLYLYLYVWFCVCTCMVVHVC